jgi:hypothetical protein
MESDTRDDFCSIKENLSLKMNHSLGLVLIGDRSETVHTVSWMSLAGSEPVCW